MTKPKSTKAAPGDRERSVTRATKVEVRPSAQANEPSRPGGGEDDR